MTIWERIQVLTTSAPTVLFQNWGENLDGASLVTAMLGQGPRRRDLRPRLHRARRLDGRHQRPQARAPLRARRRAGIPLVGMNDSAGAYVPAGVGGLDGYAEAFTALRKISGVVPSIMCMFGFNAGGGATSRARAAS
jgi:hypothetical protein